jgi:hypothetical protein
MPISAKVVQPQGNVLIGHCSGMFFPSKVPSSEVNFGREGQVHEWLLVHATHKHRHATTQKNPVSLRNKKPSTATVSAPWANQERSGTNNHEDSFPSTIDKESIA